MTAAPSARRSTRWGEPQRVRERELLASFAAMPADDPRRKAVRDELVTMFMAGHETTANALNWALYLLSQNPEAEAKLMNEIAALGGRPPAMADLARLPYSEMVIKESIRLYPPAAGATREPLHDIELGGVGEDAR